MKKFPDNLSLLHSGEETLRLKSIEIIEADADLLRHIAMVETCMDMLQYVRQNTPKMSDDQLVIALLGASVFNSIGSALKLLLGGYYQSSGLQIRYILETGWLIDYLKMDPAHVQAWKLIPESEREKKFKPWIIRNALDKRDGFVEQKRAAHYKRLCVLCGHPTFASFTMLRPDPNADAHMGPFLVQSLLEGCVQELVQCTIIAWMAVMRFFPPVTLPDYRARVIYLETHGEWMEEVFGKKPDPTLLNEIKTHIAALERKA
ncbi:MAG: hypothetical protein ABJN75_03430 [Hoeflea sp.]|uniref:hypothetical protein n=1 Tax=Hoeflea sp. TaxID=1940281 RepID=UPI00329A19AF